MMNLFSKLAWFLLFAPAVSSYLPARSRLSYQCLYCRGDIDLAELCFRLAGI